MQLAVKYGGVRSNKERYKTRDKEGDKKSEVVRYPRLRRARAGVMLKAVLAGMGQVSGGSSQVTRLLGATPLHLETAAASRTTSRVL